MLPVDVVPDAPLLPVQAPAEPLASHAVGVFVALQVTEEAVPAFIVEGFRLIMTIGLGAVGATQFGGVPISSAGQAEAVVPKLTYFPPDAIESDTTEAFPETCPSSGSTKLAGTAANERINNTTPMIPNSTANIAKRLCFTLPKLASSIFAFFISFFAEAHYLYEHPHLKHLGIWSWAEIAGLDFVVHNFGLEGS